MFLCFLFFIYASCRWISLIQFEKTPCEIMISQNISVYQYKPEYFGSMIKYLISENVDSAIILLHCSGPEFYVFYNDGRVEEYNPDKHQTKWLLVAFEYEAVYNQIKVEMEMNYWLENILCAENIAQFEANFSNKNFETNLPIIKTAKRLTKSDNYIVKEYPALRDNLRLTIAIYRSNYFRLFRESLSISQDIPKF